MNLLKNIDFDSGWTQVRGNTDDLYHWVDDTRCMSMPSVKINKLAAGAFRQQTVMSLSESGYYTFSAYMGTAGLTGGTGAYLHVSVNGQSYDSEAVSHSTAGRSTGTVASFWQRLSVTFPIDTTVSSQVTLQLVCDSTGGTIYWSCPQLERGRLANAFNMVVNSDFSQTVVNSSRLFPAYWTKIGSGIETGSGYGLIANRSDSGIPDGVTGNAMKITSRPNGGNKYVGTEIRAFGSPGDIFLVSGWCTSKSITCSSISSYEPAIAVRFLNIVNAEWSAWQYVRFGTQRSGWHNACGTIAAPVSYARIQTAIWYSSNNNTALFTNVMLSRDIYGNSYSFDSHGNIVAVKDLTAQQSAATYDSFDNLLSYIQPGSGSTEKYLFTYGDTDAEKQRHLPRTAATPEGVKTATSYDSYGNALTSTIQENDTAPLIRTETEYTDNGNYVEKQKDAKGSEVTNTLDSNGKVLSVTDPIGQQVGYTYDSSNRVIKVETAYDGKVSKNEYTYENDRIKTVAHNTTDNAASDVRYTFNYDALGRKTSVTVSSGAEGATEQTLSTNVYSADRKSRLEEVQYGNGGKVKYSYDDFDRVTGITHDNDTEPKFTFEYNAKGQAAVVRDTRGGSVIKTIMTSPTVRLRASSVTGTVISSTAHI